MAGGDEFLGVNGGGASGVAAALLFVGAGTNVYDAFSAVMSSPWSTEKFTRGSEDERMAREYVRHALIISWIYAGGGALLASRTGGWKLAVWPLVGAALVTGYMSWLYRRAVARATGVQDTGEQLPGQRPIPEPPPVEPPPNNAVTAAYVWGVPG